MTSQRKGESREDHLVRKRAYDAAHREEKRAYNAAHYAAHREEQQARNAAYAREIRNPLRQPLKRLAKRITSKTEELGQLDALLDVLEEKPE